MADNDGDTGASRGGWGRLRFPLAVALLIVVGCVAAADQAGVGGQWRVPADGAVLAVGLPTGQHPVIARTTNIVDCVDVLCTSYLRTALAVPAESAVVRPDGSVLYASVSR